MTEAAILALAALAGAAAGAAHFALLWRATKALTEGRESPLRFALAGLLRPAATAALAGGALALGAGWAELVAAAAGFAAARLGATRLARRGLSGGGA